MPEALRQRQARRRDGHGGQGKGETQKRPSHPREWPAPDETRDALERDHNAPPNPGPYWHPQGVRHGAPRGTQKGAIKGAMQQHIDWRQSDQGSLQSAFTTRSTALPLPKLSGDSNAARGCYDRTAWVNLGLIF